VGDLLVLLSDVNDSGWAASSSPGGDRVGAVPARLRVATTRRTALGGTLLGLGAVVGCDLDRPDVEQPHHGPQPTEDPDTALVDQVVTELGDLIGLVTALEAAFPRLREPMAALRELHLAHRAALGDESDPDSPVGGRPAGMAEALTLVRSRERRAQGRLADWSVAAESGALARLLAAMSAGVAQQVAVLPGLVGGEG
jgi:hypothetical protein